MNSKVEEAKRLFAYDPLTGVITRKVALGTRQKVGDVAGGNYGRYVRINAPSCRWYAHRLAWVLHYGQMPIDEIDHVNGNGRDNRIENLRQCSREQNNQNVVKSAGKSGIRNVLIVGRRFRAVLSVNGKPRHVGYFSTAEEAELAARAASIAHRGEFSIHVSRK